MTIESPPLYALFGGTFDPIHYGHLVPLETLAVQLKVEKVILLPNNIPPHRPQPQASIAQRIEMIRRAIAGNPLFSVDLREMQRSTPSWTVETLRDLRGEIGSQQPLAFIIGQDSLLSLPSWHQWHKLLDYCHLVVCQRPGYPSVISDPLLESWLEKHRVSCAGSLHTAAAGHIYLAHTPLLAISSTEIRQRLAHGENCHTLLPASVIDFIREQRLYRNPPR
ncbi:MAG: Nicotinate-nucleotide adenylyltransferase [Candidatus Erwinia impunctatus]|nr:Nicotinate-nucleotide adenylyltransferase [Culicoides impunctatus]